MKDTGKAIVEGIKMMGRSLSHNVLKFLEGARKSGVRATQKTCGDVSEWPLKGK